MCVAFHPTQPALIAGGTFSGEVRLWNTGIETDPLLASSGLSDLGHKEPISKVSIQMVYILTWDQQIVKKLRLITLKFCSYALTLLSFLS